MRAGARAGAGIGACIGYRAWWCLCLVNACVRSLLRPWLAVTGRLKLCTAVTSISMSRDCVGWVVFAAHSRFTNVQA